MSKIVINDRDSVAVTLTGESGIPAGHKIAIKDIKKGDKVIKYGEVIGIAKEDVKAGEWVHVHNVKTSLGSDGEYTYNFSAASFEKAKATFKGYKRDNRRAGIRNEIYIVPTVGCVNDVCIRLAKECQLLISGSIDGVFALTHQFGCSQLGEDNQNIKNLISSIAQNPNATNVLLVGLGCENNRLKDVVDCLPSWANHVEYFNCQEVEDEHAYGMQILKKFIENAKGLKREEVDFSELCIGLKCGGSDGYSGLTANPLVGKITDKVVSFGGSAILTEVPEMFGAEHLLMNKCKNEDVFNRYVKMIKDFKNFYILQGFPVYENPSPGNKEGGITTLEEKSLGCVQKAGSTKIVDVLGYGEQVKERGVSVLNGPGNDLIASTALGASGCQIVLFTTGRGTPFSTFVPTLKIATNDKLSGFKTNWIDFNAFSMDEDGLFNLILKTINGEYKCKSEDVREIAFYKTGVTL